MENVEETIMHRFLNTYLREAGCALDSMLDPMPAPEVGSGAPGAPGEELGRTGLPFRMNLPATGCAVLARLAKPSLGGHHRFCGPIWKQGQGPASPSRIREPQELAALLVAELEAREGEPVLTRRRRESLLKDIDASVKSVRLFAARMREWTSLKAEAAGPVEQHLEAEQGILFGHPFHPSPKSADPFVPADLESFRPEMGASFRLHWFSLAPDLVVKDFLSGAADPIPASVRAEVRARLTAGREDWPLLPSHPWQADFLLGLPEVRRLLEDGRLAHAGPAGNPVFPTSSVRTVYAPEEDMYLKLPLDARITNFVRTNPREHLQRSLAASRVLGQLVPGYAAGPLVILPETGYVGVSPHAWGGAPGEGRSPSFGVLFRKGFRGSGEAPLVVAALLEPDGEGHPRLDALLWQASRARRQPLAADFACRWFKAYVQTTMVPLLRIFGAHGLSLEAHAQNSLVSFREGWPRALFVRDLEGTTLSRERALAYTLRPVAGKAWESLLCDDAVAWQRLQYYGFVNHLGHVAAALASGGRVEEWQLWETARETLKEAKADLPGPSDYIEALLSEPTLPAKANLISRLRGRSETPLYIPIRNPLSVEALCP